MSERLRSSSDQALILVKALPHRSSNYFETVCCAGIGRDQKWRRQYPVPFRVLDPQQQFKRWTWIEYEYTAPRDDKRTESQKVVPESIQITGTMKPAERARFLAPLIRESTKEAQSKSESLTLIRPSQMNLTWRQKSAEEVESETRKHAALANQLSLLDRPAKPMEPCPFEFHFEWTSHAGSHHRHVCDDWETSTAFFRRRTALGEEEALDSLKSTYEDVYFSRGVAFALGTHKRRQDQWLMVGIIRLDETLQTELELTLPTPDQKQEDISSEPASLTVPTSRGKRSDTDEAPSKAPLSTRVALVQTDMINLCEAFRSKNSPDADTLLKVFVSTIETILAELRQIEAGQRSMLHPQLIELAVDEADRIAHLERKLAEKEEVDNGLAYLIATALRIARIFGGG